MKSPFNIKLGFSKLIDMLESNPDICKNIELDTFKHLDKLRQGFEENEDLSPYMEEIDLLLSSLFPKALTKNEIKAAIIPMTSQCLKSSERFNNAITDDFASNAPEFYDLTEDEFYILHCSYLLSSISKMPSSLKSNFYYKCEDERGIARSYRMLINFDFVNITPIGTPPNISTEDLTRLLNSPKDIELWQSFFPEDSWEMNGFTVLNFYDDTRAQSLTAYKNLLLEMGQDDFAMRAGKEKKDDIKLQQFTQVLQSYLNIPELNVGFKLYDPNQRKYDCTTSVCFGTATEGLAEKFGEKLYCPSSARALFHNHEIHVISNLTPPPKEYKGKAPYLEALYKDGIRSYLGAPLVKGDQLIGLIEIASKEPFVMNNLTKLAVEELIPLTNTRIAALVDNNNTSLRAIVQKEFTSIHPSVSWKFMEQAIKIAQTDDGIDVEDIIFEDVYALYGQSDIVGSSDLRNHAIIKDLSEQLELICEIIADAKVIMKDMPLLDKIELDCQHLLTDLNRRLDVGMEQYILHYIRTQVHPLFDVIRTDPVLENAISDYHHKIDSEFEFIYNQRKAYDQSVDRVNKELSRFLDIKQEKAQKAFPHYFERYKTDGVDHNIFIGQAISPEQNFQPVYLQNLRLWQLMTVAQMHIVLENIRSELPFPLQIASLIMVYSNTLSIRYRIDEKQFDVDGAYNARYEILKKRIDKAHIKGTKERLTQAGKIAIVFVHPEEEQNYRSMLDYLISKEFIEDKIEQLQIEDLQGVTGLKALRATVNTQNILKSELSVEDNSLETANGIRKQSELQKVTS